MWDRLQQYFPSNNRLAHDSSNPPAHLPDTRPKGGRRIVHYGWPERWPTPSPTEKPGMQCVTARVESDYWRHMIVYLVNGSDK